VNGSLRSAGAAALAAALCFSGANRVLAADPQLCAVCHGPKLRGQEHIPRLAGQQYEYLLAQLRKFKAQTRGDFDGFMTQIAQPLTDKDIEILADYAAGLSPQ
jgi:cytochrome c553